MCWLKQTKLNQYKRKIHSEFQFDATCTECDEFIQGEDGVPSACIKRWNVNKRIER